MNHVQLPTSEIVHFADCHSLNFVQQTETDYKKKPKDAWISVEL
jgi:hypothetical protein